MIVRAHQKLHTQVRPFLDLCVCTFHILLFIFYFIFSDETTIDDNGAKKPGSSTNDKKNRRKQAAINLNQGEKVKNEIG